MYTRAILLVAFATAFVTADTSAQRLRSADQITIPASIDQINRDDIEAMPVGRDAWSVLNQIPDVSLQVSGSVQWFSSFIDNDGDKNDFGGGQTVFFQHYDALATYRLGARDLGGIRVRPGLTAGVSFSRVSNTFDDIPDRTATGLGNVYLGANLATDFDPLVLYGNITFGADVAGEPDQGDPPLTDDQHYLDASISADYLFNDFTVKADAAYAIRFENDNQSNGNFCTMFFGASKYFEIGGGGLSIGGGLAHMTRGKSSFDGQSFDDSNGSFTSFGFELQYDNGLNHIGITGAGGEVGHPNGQFRIRARQWEGYTGSYRFFYQRDIHLGDRAVN